MLSAWLQAWELRGMGSARSFPAPPLEQKGNPLLPGFSWSPRSLYPGRMTTCFLPNTTQHWRDWMSFKSLGATAFVTGVTDLSLFWEIPKEKGCFVLICVTPGHSQKPWFSVDTQEMFETELKWYTPISDIWHTCKHYFWHTSFYVAILQSILGFHRGWWYTRDLSVARILIVMI